VHYSNRCGIFANEIKYIRRCHGLYLADSSDNYRGEKIDEVQLLLIKESQ
jgi:hypothetical protein